MKKRSMVLLSLLLVMSFILLACSKTPKGNDNQANTPVDNSAKADKPTDTATSFTLVGRKEPLAPDWNEMELFINLEKQTGVHIDWNLVPTANWDTKRSLILSGNLPDGFFAASYPDYEMNEAIKDGVFISLTDLIEEHAPNIKKVFERAPYLKALVTSEDGNIYSLPVVEELALGHARNFVSINKTWLDELGLSVPETPEEFKTALIAFRDNDMNGNGDPNDEIPFAFLNMFWCSDIGDLMAAFGVADNNEHVIVTEDHELVFTANRDEYRAALEYFADLYKEGLIDPEAFTAADQFQLILAKGQSHRLGAYIWWETAEVAGEFKDEYVLMQPWKNASGQRVTGRSNDKDGGKGAFMITSACKDPVALIKWVDTLYDPYMAAQVHWGPPGEDNLLIDKDGYLAYNPNLKTEAGERRQQIAPNGVGCILNEDFGTVVDAEPRAMERLEDIRKYFEPYMPTNNFPKGHIAFTDAEIGTIGEIEQMISDYVRESRAEFITGGVTDKSWNAYVEALDTYGLDTLMNVYREGYKRYLSKLN